MTTVTYTTPGHNHLHFHFRPLSLFMWFSKKRNLLTVKLRDYDLRKEPLLIWSYAGVYVGVSNPLYAGMFSTWHGFSKGAASCAGACLQGDFTALLPEIGQNHGIRWYGLRPVSTAPCSCCWDALEALRRRYVKYVLKERRKAKLF